MFKNFSHLLRYFILFFLCHCLLSISGVSGCGGNALPQASIPPPAVGNITISSPDAEGFVTIQGSESAVPDSSTVVVEVGEEITSSEIHREDWMTALSKKMLRPAYASEICSSGFSTCPDLSDGKCELVANDDGSFLLRVPAENTDTISIWYLASENDCEASDTLTIDSSTEISRPTAVSAHLISTSFVPSSEYIAYLGENDSGYVSGLYDPENNSLEDITLPSFSGVPISFQIIEDFNGSEQFFLALENESLIGTMENNTVSHFYSVLDTDSASDIENARLIFSEEITPPSQSGFTCIADYSTYTSTSHTRSFISLDGTTSADARLLVLDDVSNPTNYTTRAISLSLVGPSILSTTSGHGSIRIHSIPFMHSLDDEAVLVVGVIFDGGSEISYYAIGFYSGDGLCSSITPTAIMHISDSPLDSPPPLVTVIDKDSSMDTEANWLMVFDHQEKNLSTYDWTNLSIQHNVDLSTTLLDLSVIRVMSLSATDDDPYLIYLQEEDNLNSVFIDLNTGQEHTDEVFDLVNLFTTWDAFFYDFGSESYMVFIDNGETESSTSYFHKIEFIDEEL